MSTGELDKEGLMHSSTRSMQHLTLDSNGGTYFASVYTYLDPRLNSSIRQGQHVHLHP